MNIRMSVRILIAICTLPFLFLTVVGILQIYYDGIMESFSVSFLSTLAVTFIGSYLSLIGRIPTKFGKSG